jgi:hypothetical protein
MNPRPASIFENTKNRASAARKRNALSLVEVMLVVALTSILLGIVINFAFGLRHFDYKMRDNAVQSEQLAELAERIRGDARRATDVSLTRKEILVVSRPNNTRVRYELRPEGCQRIADNSADKHPRNELFAIGPSASWRIENSAPGRRRGIVVSLLGSQPDQSETAPTLLLLYATLGAELPASPDATATELPKSNP